VPVLDLHRLTGAGECPPHLSSRIILVPHGPPDGPEGLLGLLATQVADIREVAADARPLAGLAGDAGVDLGAVLADGKGLLRLLDPDKLLGGSAWRELLALPAEGRA
jgi:chemotaxis-related protein WspB